jgi:2-keto-4-pentenoate hydratase/2-oxohepta-3-ene-1,7-dioic acid hydratase in catechol pathway
MKFATFHFEALDRYGLVIDENILDLTTAPAGVALPKDLETFIKVGEIVVEAAADLEQRALKGQMGRHLIPLSKVRLLAPFPHPHKNVFCVGRNYFKHALEGAKARGEELKLPSVPELFTKPPTAVIGPDDEIYYDSGVTTQVDYESELAVVIGKRGRNIARENAYDHVFGYTVVNDVSARDIQYAHGGQWFKGKALDGSCPMGPAIVHKSSVPNPHNLGIWLRLNGEVMQDANTGDMTFDIPSVIEILSRGLTLEPGDVISTGTPPGVGFAREPKVFLKPGDVVEAEVESIGVLRNTVGPDQNPDR